MLPVVMFLIIALGALALTVARFSGQSSLAAAQEAISLQAFYAAESGGQYAMNQVYYVASGGSAITRAAATANCASVNGDLVNFGGAGLANCSATITCSSNVDGGSATTFFSISSNGNCGSGSTSASRRIQVSSFIREGL
ncbi:MAG: hypothetical protein ACRBBW_04150 [Cellvibrionaceae bacterium]